MGVVFENGYHSAFGSRVTGISGGPCTQEAPGGNLSTGFPKKISIRQVSISSTAEDSAVHAAQRKIITLGGGVVLTKFDLLPSLIARA